METPMTMEKKQNHFGGPGWSKPHRTLDPHQVSPTMKGDGHCFVTAMILGMDFLRRPHEEKRWANGIRMYATKMVTFTINKNPKFVSIWIPYMDPMGSEWELTEKHKFYGNNLEITIGK